jgi:hypothetical protein
MLAITLLHGTVMAEDVDSIVRHNYPANQSYGEY